MCRRFRNSIYNWAQGLGRGPDVSHAVDVSHCKTEGNGVGDLSEPPVPLEENKSGQSWLDDVKLCHDEVKRAVLDADKCRLTVHIVVSDTVSFDWETILFEGRLFVEVPKYILPEGSKERCFALYCCHVLSITKILLLVNY